MRTRIPTFRELDTQRSKDEMPDDFGHRTRRCRICDAFLCRYNGEEICFCHQPQGEGVLIEVAPNHWRRFVLAHPERGEQIHELMVSA